MKIIERITVPKSKYGKIIFTNTSLEKRERDTIFCLSSFGFNIETLVPSDIPNSKNPDLLMLGTYWEVKTPSTSNEKTIKYHFRKAAKQSNGRTIFDIRNVHDKSRVEKTIISLFEKTRRMRRIIIIETDEKIIDITK